MPPSGFLACLLQPRSLLALAALAAMASQGGCLAPRFQPPPEQTLQDDGSAAVPGQLRVRFFGVSTLLLDDGCHAVMIDGFLTRPGRREVVFGNIGPDECRIKTALARGGVKDVDLVLVAHSHFDHAMDSAVVARITGACLAGSSSTRMIADGQKFNLQRFHLIGAGGVLRCGAFEIQIFQTPHSSPERYRGTIDAPLDPPQSRQDYLMGENFSFLLRHPSGNVLVVPSAGDLKPDTFVGHQANVVFLGVAGLGRQSTQSVDEYWRSTVKTVGATLVVPIHWDDFTQPAEEPLRPLPFPFDNFRRTRALLEQLAPKDSPVAVRYLPLYETRLLPLSDQAAPPAPSAKSRE